MMFELWLISRFISASLCYYSEMKVVTFTWNSSKFWTITESFKRNYDELTFTDSIFSFFCLNNLLESLTTSYPKELLRMMKVLKFKKVFFCNFYFPFLQIVLQFFKLNIFIIKSSKSNHIWPQFVANILLWNFR